MPAEGSRGVADVTSDGLGLPIPEIPGYSILERIGKGGMGEVYLARQLALGRLVAIKFLRPDGPMDPEHDTARFRREAELMAKVKHPNILSIHDFGEADGYYYLIAEFAEGGDLRRRMSPGFPMPIDEVRSLILPVGEALAYLHRQGIVHRDLKPENILLDEEGKPIVSDFGISILGASGESLTGTGRGPGTFGYVAPEQHHGLKVDERADQYSLAALAYEMLTGQLPLGIFKPPSRLNPRLRPEVDGVILRALREEPKDRFESIGEFASRLDRALVVPRLAALWPALRAYGWVALPLLVVAGAVLAHSARSPRQQVPPRPPDARPPRIIEAVPKKAKPAEDPLIHEMKALRAVEIWKNRGSPVGKEGKAAEQSIWFEAAAGVDKDLEVAAYQFWEQGGKPKGAEGDRAKPVNWDKAVRRLYREMTGKAPPGP